MELPELNLYAIIGEAGFARLVSAFYGQIPGDDILGPMYPPNDLVAAERRLRGFLIQRFGGPDLYSRERGHPRLRMRHAPFHIDVAARNRWIQIMDRALAQVEMPEEVTAQLRAYFASTATFMINQP